MPSSVRRNLLELPLLRELLIQHLQLLHQLLTSLHHRLFWTDFSIGLHAELERREEWVWDLVAGEEDMLGLYELCAEEVAEGVVFLVEGENRGVGHACRMV